MKNDRPSETASFVTMGRALAHAHKRLPGFDDPFALALLPDAHRQVIERRLDGRWARNRREAALGWVAEVMERLVGPRTVVIDEALRESPRRPQVVIVAAGLDARAYRLAELSESIVFEVDHPATQAAKRSRAAGFTPVARELRHVAVDLLQQSLGDALAGAGHDAWLPTTWVIEGIITYLRRSEVDTVLRAVAQRSSPGSRIVATYNEPRWSERLFGGVGARLGEPARSSFSRAEMRALLGRHGFDVSADRDGHERVVYLGVAPSLVDRHVIRFHHVVVADRAPVTRSVQAVATR
ncbi:MAG: class I SAM-dependent methyltransferase [Polyangiaceae bacterium]|nr:class I SAM-dependent methyltransferase [Polyangiaceae bacterium]